MSRDYSRQSFLGEPAGSTFATIKVGIAGLGGGGSHIAQQLAHVGIQGYVVADPDRVENSNLNRLIGARADDVGHQRSKAEVILRTIVGLNPTASVEATRGPWQDSQVSFRECNVIFGCLDSYGEREQLERFCRRFLIPYIDIGMDVHKYDDGYRIVGQVIQSFPNCPCLWCTGFINNHKLTREVGRYGDAGARPQVVWPNGMLASAAVGLFVQLVTTWGPKDETRYLEYNGNDLVMGVSPLLEHVRSETCSHYASSQLGDPFFSLPQP